MSIPQSQYVSITSQVIPPIPVQQRQLICRLFTDSGVLPPESFIEFSNATQVGAFFGTTSQEYYRAVFYFNWTSKQYNSPPLISYARWVDAAVAPYIRGISATYLVSNFSSISNGSIGLTLGPDTVQLTPLDFTGAATLSDVAGVFQTAIQAAEGITLWEDATVVYDAVTESFNLLGGATGAAAVAIQPGATGTDVSALVGWYPQLATVNNNYTAGTYTPGAIWSPGAAIESIAVALQNSVNNSTNFGTFVVIPSLTLDQNIIAATWNQEQGVQYKFNVPVLLANASSWGNVVSGLGGFEGTSLTRSDISGQYAELESAMIMAATDYTVSNSVQDYEFQIFPGLTPSVTSQSDANSMNALFINYYGQTQSAGQILNFYQEGLMMGGATAITDEGIYANELWLKDSIATSIMNLSLVSNSVPANQQGQIMILGSIQPNITQALSNGTISVGKPLTTEQINQITDATRAAGAFDPNAWQQIQNLGYWRTCQIVPVGSPITYQAQYTLIYSKNDVIRFVSGTHILI